jgi:hypothetical protein
MKTTLVGIAFILGLSSASAATAPVSFTELTGTTGGVPAETAVFRASLAGLGLASIQSITITDNSAGLGGSPGQFSGFDLDAIRLSNTSVATAAAATALAGLSVFDFSSGALFTPGVQRPPADPKLFGTGPGGNTVDNGVATLGAFDGNSTTAIPGAAGFFSMGDGGSLVLNLTSAVSTTNLFLYIGEVGNNGELAAGTITISDTPVRTPEGGATITMLGLALSALMYLRRRLALGHR